MRERKTSRVLNDESYFLGLSYNDISGAGILLLALLLVSKALGVKSMLWALMLTISVLVMLIPVRLRFRRKILRDALKYVLTNGVNHVSKNRRNKSS
ncbi:hypothetical protein [Bdellovibrio sp.]|uniref:hypothetical protein n=1 Tax=Bdellovibrio sp. TaxID=28201 RepID=UPI0032219430|nr:hypothetical protein HAGR004_16480 [Bdellovibrio sp. HAGR004]